MSGCFCPLTGAYIYIYKGADWAAILERGLSHLCGVKRRLGLEREE
jgi:hypothetical protein